MSRTLPRPRPGRPLLRRGPTQVQVGLDPRTAVVVDRLTPTASAALLRLDGTLGHHDLVDEHPELLRLLETLHDRGLLDDEPGPRTRTSANRRERLALDLAALALTSSTDAAHTALARRTRAIVAVRGDDRCAALIAIGLAAAGIGTVDLQCDDRPVTLADLTPSGPHEPTAGWRDQVADGVRRQGAHPSPSSVRRRAPAAVAVVGSADVDLPWTDPELADDLLADGVPHLAVAVAGTSARIGPFVLPGRSACLWCLDHRHRDQDAAWPALADQVRLRHPRARTSLGVTSSAAAAMAVAHLLQVVDDPASVPATVDAQVVLTAPDLLAERVPVVRHPVCGCGWAATTTTMVG